MIFQTNISNITHHHYNNQLNLNHKLKGKYLVNINRQYSTVLPNMNVICKVIDNNTEIITLIGISRSIIKKLICLYLRLKVMKFHHNINAFVFSVRGW
jgi:hypothetical protein